MNYKETLEYLYNQLPVYQRVGASAYKEGLGNSLALDRYLDHPHRKYRTIHVGGTNGKGSVSHFLSAILQEAGYKTGLYTSPHLIDFRERIKINGEMIDRQYIVDFIANHKSFFEPLHPSFFELTMIMAFQYFADNKVDVAVIEVGMGGRLDSTNIITPDLSVITNISFDHTQFLGDTLEKIASEKAGIIKPGIPVVIGEAGTVRRIFEEKAESLSSPILFAEEKNPIIAQIKTPENLILQTSEYPDLKSGLLGDYQIKNAATVLTSVDALVLKGYNISKRSVYEGFKGVEKVTGLMGRWQTISESPRIICDTGHNVAGIEFIVNQLTKEPYEQLHIVIGMVNDKDITKVLNLLPRDAVYYFTQADIPRALDADKLKEQAKVFNLNGSAYHSVKEAVTASIQNAGIYDLIFIGGSNFVVGEFLPLFFD